MAALFGSRGGPASHPAPTIPLSSKSSGPTQGPGRAPDTAGAPSSWLQHARRGAEEPWGPMAPQHSASQSAGGRINEQGTIILPVHVPKEKMLRWRDRRTWNRCTTSRSSDLTVLRTQSSWAGGGVWSCTPICSAETQPADLREDRQSSLPPDSQPATRALGLKSTCFPETVVIPRAQGLNEAPDPLTLPHCLQAEVN